MAGAFEGKTVLITGSGGGQGRAAALRFALAGAQVVGCDVKEEGNRETAALVREAGGSITTMQPIDLGDPDSARRWIDEAAALHGRIDVLYNNASAARVTRDAQADPCRSPSTKLTGRAPARLPWPFDGMEWQSITRQ